MAVGRSVGIGLTAWMMGMVIRVLNDLRALLDRTGNAFRKGQSGQNQRCADDSKQQRMFGGGGSPFVREQTAQHPQSPRPGRDLKPQAD